MVVLRPQSEFGHAPPPQTPYSIVTNLPGWDVAKAIRDGDMSALARIVHIYPRFSPTQYAAELGKAIAKTLGLEGLVALPYLNPEIGSYTRRHVTLEQRKEHVMKPEDVLFRCVDVGGHRVYTVLYEPRHMKGAMATWSNPGIGLSIRAGEQLLKDIDTMKEVEMPSDIRATVADMPTPTWTPEGPSHQGIRERIVELLHRAPLDPAKVACEPKDVFLYPTGMAAVFHTSNTLLRHRPGTIVVLGVVFHNTYHHLVEESPHGWKHFGRVDDQGIDAFESWLDEETKSGRIVSHTLVEVPGNPTLDTVDITRLRNLSIKHGFILILDDTIAGFGNVDILNESDILLTSLTKSFSGQSNVMGGSIVLNPLSPHYHAISSVISSTHHNELFIADADVLLANSQDFLPRTRRLNRNAHAMAAFLDGTIADPDSPVVNVQYPALLSSKGLYDKFKRPSTKELPEPGYGCLMTVEFETVATARAFYDRLGFYPSPHLGGHVSLSFCYNMLMFSKMPEESAYMRTCGVKEESVRISAGLEDVEDLIDTLKDALDAAIEAKKNGGGAEST
ncbi:coagulation factor 5/8 type domain protein [Purpureocillium lavendulum]|uniref:Coagulation factor 5/8 type domain protein n=1 Tax=Purpureocillium lavendulum TaxID=1247861 RepID=A0AB34FVL8_9HYPO|nr:coagulation factor 5/8 type domain protein [Purpureocillium lavendulum]